MTLSANPIALRALQIARAQVGKPYVWGATGPNSFDCSGLCVYSYRTAGYYLARLNDAGLAAAGARVAAAALLPGDLVRPHIGHIQMYAGGGRVVEAANAASPVREVAMWGFLDGTRIVAASSTPSVSRSRLLFLTSPYLTGNDVRSVQARTGAGVDGVFGPATRAAVLAFQRRHWPRWPAQWDGVVGQATARALGIGWV